MILIDTTPLVALCDARDSYHARAVADLDSLKRLRFGVCEAVLVEACFHLAQPSQRSRLRAFLDKFDVVGLTGTSDSLFWSLVFDWMEKFADQQPDWADACLAVLSAENRKLKIWTYDREFRTTWRRLDGSAIPMAVRG